MKSPIKPAELLARVEAAWDAARGDRKSPRRSDIDPTKFGSVLPYLALLDVVRDGDKIDFRYRLVGQHLTKYYGFNVTGHLHNVIASERRLAKPFYERYAHCASAHKPETFDIETRNRNEVPVRVTGGLWPLSDDGVEVSGLLGAALYSVPDSVASYANASSPPGNGAK